MIHHVILLCPTRRKSCERRSILPCDVLQLPAIPVYQRLPNARQAFRSSCSRGAAHRISKRHHGGLRLPRCERRSHPAWGGREIEDVTFDDRESCLEAPARGPEALLGEPELIRTRKHLRAAPVGLSMPHAIGTALRPRRGRPLYVVDRTHLRIERRPCIRGQSVPDRCQEALLERRKPPPEECDSFDHLPGISPRCAELEFG